MIFRIEEKQEINKSDGGDGDVEGTTQLFLNRPVKWNGRKLSKQEYMDASHAIRNCTSIQNRGYDCSACDPLLIAVTAVFQVTINHQISKWSVMVYEPIHNDAGHGPVPQKKKKSSDYHNDEVNDDSKGGVVAVTNPQQPTCNNKPAITNLQ